MHTLRLSFAIAALSGLYAFGGAAMAQTASTAAPVICKDGTTSAKTGKGACSHHGGVNKGPASTTPASAAAAPAATASTAAPAATAATAAVAGSPVQCKDGSTSTKSGKGACSHHGGVGAATSTASATPAAAATKTEASSAATPAAMKPASTSASTPTSTSTSTKAPSAMAAAGGGVTADPTGAEAKCKDGLYSHAKVHTGACSHHGGVATWLDKTN